MGPFTKFHSFHQNKLRHVLVIVNVHSVIAFPVAAVEEHCYCSSYAVQNMINTFPAIWFIFLINKPTPRSFHFNSLPSQSRLLSKDCSIYSFEQYFLPFLSDLVKISLFWDGVVVYVALKEWSGILSSRYFSSLVLRCFPVKISVRLRFGLNTTGS